MFIELDQAETPKQIKYGHDDDDDDDDLWPSVRHQAEFH